MEDLFPVETTGHVVGEADMTVRVGVFSFARFNPHFWRENDAEEEVVPLDEEDYAAIMYRSCKVMAHEVCAVQTKKPLTLIQCNRPCIFSE